MAGAQDISGLMASAQIWRKIRRGVYQLSKINDALDIGCTRRVRKIARHFEVTPGIDLSTLLAMDKVIGG
jgi:hypothetical protein